MRPCYFFAVVGPLALTALHGPAAAQDTSENQLAFNNHCRTCHTTDPGDSRLGPSLANVVGRKAGTLEGFAFSQAMTSSGIVWDEKTLDSFIANPEQVVPSNNMKPYTGLTDAGERKKIVAFLAEHSGKSGDGGGDKTKAK